MQQPSLQFHAAASPAVLIALLGAIAAVLIVQGVRHLVWRQRRRAVMFFCAAAGPVALLPALAAEAVRQYRARNRQAPTLLAVSAAGVAAGAAAAAILAGRSAQAAWMILVALEAAAAMGAFYAAAYAHLGAGRLAGLAAIRIAAVVALILALFKPAISITVDPRSLRPVLAVLVDRSGSMATAEQDGAPPRFAQAVSALVANKQRLESVFRPAWMTFAASPEPGAALEAIAGMRPSGPGSDGTDITSAISSAAARRGDQKAAAVLLLSDGINNGAGSPAQAAARAGVPMYAAAVGSADHVPPGRRNIALLSVDAPLDIARETIASVRAAFQVDRLADAPVEVRLLDEATGAVLDTAMLSARAPSEVLTADLKWTAEPPQGEPNQTGQVRRLVVAATPNPAEAVSEDNSAPLHVLVTEPRIGVLYVEGSIRPEYKYLRRLLDGDEQIQLATLVRVSDNRFWAQGSIAGRQATALPTKEEDFRGLKVIIIGDLDRSFLTDQQMAAIRRFVNSGGGLLMLGGHNSFGPGGYGGTDIEAILPVAVGGRNEPQETAPFLPLLTAAGAAHPAMAGMDQFLPSPGKTPERSQELPNLAGCVAVLGAKAGATVLAVDPSQRNESGPLIVLAVQQVGGGRTAAFTADTTWRWYLPLQAMGTDGPYPRFWRQLVRYLANAEADTGRQKPSVVLRVDRAYLQLGATCKITLRASDGSGSPIDLSRIHCTISPASGGRETVLAVSPGTGPLLAVTAALDEPGGHRIKASASDKHGAEIASDELTIVAAGASAETDRLAADPELLRTIAEQSGGQMADLASLPRLIEQMIERHGIAARGVPLGRTYRLYNFPLLFGVFVVLVSLEWLLRRRWELQ